MSERRVVLKLNQQQRELVDKTVTRGEAADRQALVKRALREFAARHKPVEASAGGKKE
jgi:Arc/MetJ-type ribon-helix-helix transcriptional regulator